VSTGPLTCSFKRYNSSRLWYLYQIPPLICTSIVKCSVSGTPLISVLPRHGTVGVLRDDTNTLEEPNKIPGTIKDAYSASGQRKVTLRRASVAQCRNRK